MTTSKDFFQAWLNVVEQPERLATLKTIWSNYSEFTNEIITNENSVIDDISKTIGLKVYKRNYYSLDAIFYNVEDKVPETNSNTYWFKDIEIAFEHENTYNNNLFQEVAHLLITRCNLRVLVSYPQNDKEPVSNYLHKVISSCNIANEISVKENFLFILGYHYDGKCEWEGWIYQLNEWVKI
ncbi:hypothetical protein [Flavobacterium sp.]|uniref:hypothetical protein n=1 Tax=Flavobacterium sp. TaxID=239 RepID=UPI002B4B6655|nr:hypothetical protein [Flavobacterium sp.]HLP64755.1 hypothetical protein [Flavobacterium sp.]